MNLVIDVITWSQAVFVVIGGDNLIQALRLSYINHINVLPF